MKVKILSDGEYVGFENVTFPVNIEARKTTIGHGFRVSGADIQCIDGCDSDAFDPEDTYFFANYEIEVIEE